MRPIASAVVAPILLLAACASPRPLATSPPAPAEPRSTVVLLADADGTVGRVTVSNEGGSSTLERERAATQVYGEGTAPTAPATMSPAQIEATFGAALSVQPPPARHFILYFEQASTDLTAASRAELPAIVAAVREYASVDTSVTGHSDTAGNARANLELSLRRALAVGALLAAEGIDPGVLDVTSHGETNPVVQTGDNVSEPRNRRVEVTVR